MAEEASGADRLLDPARMHRAMRDLPIDQLTATFHEAQSVGARAWMTLSLVIAEMQRQGGYGDGVLAQIADACGIHRGTAGTLGQIARTLLIPRIEAMGDGAMFVLEQREYYTIACRAAEALGRPAPEILAQAEEKKAADPKYSTRRFREELDLGDEGSTISEAPALWRLVKRASKLESPTIAEACATIDPIKVLDSARDALAAMTEIVGLLEQRIGGAAM